MNRRFPFSRILHTTALPAIGMVLLLAVCSLRADRVFKYPRIRQEKDNWCWSACSQWILGFHGITLSQTDICRYGFTDGVIRDQWNWIFCSSENGLRIVTGRDTCYGRGINQIINHFGVPYKVKQGGNSYYTLTKDEFRAEIENGHPFVIRYNWDDGDGHFVVAMGYQNDLCWVMNPWRNDGIQIFDYEWILDNKNGPLQHHVWDYTVQTTRVDTIPELTTEFPASIPPGTEVSLKLTSRLNGRDVTGSTFFTPLTKGLAIDSATRTVSWKQTEEGPDEIRIIREFGNARDTIIQSFSSTATVPLQQAPAGEGVTIARQSGGYAVYIATSGDQTGRIRVQLFGPDGRSVFVRDLRGGGHRQVVLPVSGFTSGIYLLSVSGISIPWTKKLLF
jgi:hypothetical protein